MIAAAFTGRVCRAPILKISARGHEWLSFSVAVKDGSETQFVNVSTFGLMIAEAGSLVEGQMVSIEGDLRISEYVKDGTQRAGINIVASRIAALKRGPRHVQPSTAPSRRLSDAVQAPLGAEG